MIDGHPEYVPQKALVRLSTTTIVRIEDIVWATYFATPPLLRVFLRGEGQEPMSLAGHEAESAWRKLCAIADACEQGYLV